MTDLAPDFTLQVNGGNTHLLITLIRVVTAIPVLILSLALYMAGVLLTVTVVGAILGIPLILATYAIDVFALALLIHGREKMHLVTCPKCRRRQAVLLSLKDSLVCRRCRSYIVIENI